MMKGREIEMLKSSYELRQRRWVEDFCKLAPTSLMWSFVKASFGLKCNSNDFKQFLPSIVFEIMEKRMISWSPSSNIIVMTQKPEFFTTFFFYPLVVFWKVCFSNDPKYYDFS